MKPEICVLGSVNLDLVIKTKTLPRAGETVGGGSYTALPGGKGANLALAARRLGANVELRACIGQDSYAQIALENLKAEKVELSQLIEKAETHTGLAFINVSNDGENQIAVASGANGIFLPRDLKSIKADALIAQFEIPLDTVLEAFKNFKGFKALKPSPIASDITPFLPLADLLIVNEIEYQAYEEQLKGYEGIIVKTMGEHGAVMMRDGSELTRSNPPTVKIVDTTGAGDCFAAAIVVALCENQSHQKALEFACIAAALSATNLGAQSASPMRPDVEKLLN